MHKWAAIAGMAAVGPFGRVKFQQGHFSVWPQVCLNQQLETALPRENCTPNSKYNCLLCLLLLKQPFPPPAHLSCSHSGLAGGGPQGCSIRSMSWTRILSFDTFSPIARNASWSLWPTRDAFVSLCMFVPHSHLLVSGCPVPTNCTERCASKLSATQAQRNAPYSADAPSFC